MRLIDADELITQMCWKLGLGDEENGANVDYMEALEDCKELINNAPTVRLEYVPNYANCESVAMVRVSRPQGEWIDIDSLVSKAMCSNCKNIIITEPFGKPKTCPNCGADMRGKADQLRDCENCIHHSDNGCEVWECEFEKRSDV